MIGVRRICFWTMRAIAGKKGVKREKDLFPLEIDKIIRREKIKNMKPIEVTRTVKRWSVI